MAYPSISVKTVAEKLQSDTSAVLVDVRTPAEHGSIHAENALSVPLNNLNPAKCMESYQLCEQSTLYVICKSGARAKMACDKFEAAGINNIVLVQGGTDAWAKAGLPVVRGKKEIMSLERQVRIATGSLVFMGTLLGLFVDIRLTYIATMVGAGLVFAGVTDSCAMGMFLSRMPWNQANDSTSCCTQ